MDFRIDEKNGFFLPRKKEKPSLVTDPDTLSQANREFGIEEIKRFQEKVSNGLNHAEQANEKFTFGGNNYDENFNLGEAGIDSIQFYPGKKLDLIFHTPRDRRSFVRAVHQSDKQGWRVASAKDDDDMKKVAQEREAMGKKNIFKGISPRTIFKTAPEAFDTFFSKFLAEIPAFKNNLSNKKAP